MVSKHSVGFVALSLFVSSAFGRMQLLERDGKPIFLHPRRFDQQNPQVLTELSSACPGQVCGNLAGAAVTPLLAASGECTQQDMADQIIDAAAQFDNATASNMIALAIQYRQAEKNTPPDFTTNPPTNRNSVFCQKAPKNSQLIGLVQAQDPANDPNVFFDPATGKSVTKGDQTNTFPFGTAGSASDPNGSTSGSSSVAASASSTASEAATSSVAAASVAVNAAVPCSSVVTVTVTAAADVATAVSSDAVTVSVGSATTTSAAAVSTATNIGDFGSCSVPEIIFGTGFDGRKETAFEPADQTSYDHGSADNIGIIATFICNTLVNSCGADATAQATCAQAQAAIGTFAVPIGLEADQFNAVFGITTNFNATPSVDDTGKFVAGTGAPGSQTSGTPDFGSCTTPEINFGVGFDGRTETSFEPADQTSYNHGSADNINIITQFICDTLVNSCGANAVANALCTQAQSAVTGASTGSGGQADLFNAVFGITTDFAAVAQINDQGQTVAAGAVAAASTPAAAASSTTAAAAAATTTSSAAAAAATTSSAAAASTTSSAASASTSSTSTSTTSGTNLQTFTGALGGVTPPAVTNVGGDRPFEVEGNADFPDLLDALVRSCDVQHNQCANAANSSGNQGDLTVDACGTQQTSCNSNAQTVASAAGST